VCPWQAFKAFQKFNTEGKCRPLTQIFGKPPKNWSMDNTQAFSSAMNRLRLALVILSDEENKSLITLTTDPASQARTRYDSFTTSFIVIVTPAK
jgi:hypothetical protein